MDYLGGFWRRLGADLLDSILISGILWILFDLLFGLNYTSDMVSNITSLIYILYATLLPIYWGGYVIGKRILKIHIERIDEESINIWTMLKREVLGKQILAAVSLGIVPIVSAFMVGIRQDKRAIHDFIAGTHVVRDDMY